MTKEELIEALRQAPNNYEVCFDCDPGLCNVENVDIDWNNNRIILYNY